MDLYDTKSRVAEAFVESVFRRARFHVRPHRGARPLLRIGHEDFSPNFAVSRNGDDELLVEVKYRASIEQFLALETQRRDASIFVLARRYWPRLYFVLVTDHPRPGRSCFQAIAFAGAAAPPFTTLDLVAIPELRIFPHNVDDHERLLLRLLGLLTRSEGDGDLIGHAAAEERSALDPEVCRRPH